MFYQTNDWIGELPTAVQTEIRERMVMRTLVDGERLYERGADPTGLYQVLTGFLLLKAAVTSGNEILITIYGPGCCLGEIPLLGDGERAFDAVAKGEVQVAVLPRADFEELSLRHPEIYQRLVAKLCKVIVGLLSRIEGAALLTLRQRLAKLILSAAEAYGTTQQEGVVISMPLSQADMGQMLGVTRHSIQRELKCWEGLIEKQKGHWVITDIDALKGLQKG